jgi:Tol biopolymer transport system component/DNA-binding winged helix-turn-helix (wHTH) protein
MSPKQVEFYEFADFRLDLHEKALFHGGEPVRLTPKLFDTLRVLLENSGRLLEKDELIREIWKEAFVEESNLTSNIKTLRRFLGDDASNPKFIETVPRRGYRFICDVRKVELANGSINGAAPENSEQIEPGAAKPFIFKGLLLPLFVVLAVGSIAVGLWYSLGRGSRSAAPILTEPFSSQKLSTDGKVYYAAISTDGKMVVYSSGAPGEKQSVWLRQLETGINTQIIPPSDDNYHRLTLSHDGNFLYFVRGSNGPESTADIYRVSIFGGIPTRLVSDSQAAMSISPDDRLISFVRCPHRNDEYCSLYIADAADGKNEKKLTSRPGPFRIGGNSISPDGRFIAFAAGQSENAASEFTVYLVDIESSTESELTSEKFFNIQHLAWLPDQSGVLLTASRIPNKTFRIWYISAGTGEVNPLTKDSETYGFLSLDREARRLVSTQIEQDFHLRLYGMGDTRSQPLIIADGTGLSFAPNGKIVFSSLMTGGDDNIWSINPDGGGKLQLTHDSADDRVPVVSTNGNWIFFSSNRTGEAHVWRMNVDGSDQIQITQKEGGFPIFVSPDGRWIYYHHGLQRTLWRASTAGGTEEVVINKKEYRFAISPDGSMAAFPEKEGDHDVLMIVSLADGHTVETFTYAEPNGRLIELKWSSNGKDLAYILKSEKSENKTLLFQPLHGGPPRKITTLGNEEIADSGFALTPDGKSFAITQGGWRHDAVLLEGLK